MRPIDADALIEKAQTTRTRVLDNLVIETKVINVTDIETAPALDVAPVVRCKDCVHAAPLEGYASRKFEIGLNCRACRGDSGYGITGLSFTVPDGYCDDGLRKWDEAE